MNKDFSQQKFQSFETEKQLRVLLELTLFIEKEKVKIDSSHFQKLTKYHSFLTNNKTEIIQKIHKEFLKIKSIDYQFQIYLMNLERAVGQSSKEYQFLVDTKDSQEKKKTLPIICVFDSIRSAHNIGSMFRNADCFGINKVFLCGLSPTPTNIQVEKTAMGTTKTVEWEYNKDAIEVVKHLKDLGATIWAIETSKLSKPLKSVSEVPDNIVLLFGHEHYGLSLELIQLSDQVINIELFGVKNSLNVGMCQAIVLNHIAQIIT